MTELNGNHVLRQSNSSLQLNKKDHCETSGLHYILFGDKITVPMFKENKS